MKVYKGTFKKMKCTFGKDKERAGGDIFEHDDGTMYYWADNIKQWMLIPRDIRYLAKDRIQKQIRLDKLDELGI
jgi:hypothetical protein